MESDPQTNEIKEICESLVGAKINIGFTITLNDSTNLIGEINNCNIIGDCMEDIIFPIINKKINTFSHGPKQASPDFYNSEIWEYELKCFMENPNFDISNFNSYISQLTENLERKMYKTKYLIFKYKIDETFIYILDFKLCSIWEIINYSGKRPISIQSKKDMWYNIRPCSFKDMKNKEKTPSLFIENICKAITLSPNKFENKENIINIIMKQFNHLESNKQDL